MDMMKDLITAVVLLTTVGFGHSARQPVQYNLDEAPQLFQKFMIDYHRVYKNSADAKAHFDAFKSNLESYNVQNLKNFPNGGIIIINALSDFTTKEKQDHPSFQQVG